MIELVILLLLGFYMSAGAIFAVVFLFVGMRSVRLADRLDPVLEESSFSIRFLLLPGAAAVWPILLHKIIAKHLHAKAKQ